MRIEVQSQCDCKVKDGHIDSDRMQVICNKCSGVICKIHEDYTLDELNKFMRGEQ